MSHGDRLAVHKHEHSCSSKKVVLYFRIIIVSAQAEVDFLNLEYFLSNFFCFPSLVSGKILFEMYGVTSRAGGCNKERLLEIVDNLRQQDVVDVYTFANAVSVIDSMSVSSLEDSNFLASFSNTYERERQHMVVSADDIRVEEKELADLRKVTL